MTRGAVVNAKLFCEDQFNKEFISVLGDIREEVLSSHQLDVGLIFLQKFVNWLGEDHPHLKMTPTPMAKEGAPCMAKGSDSIRGYVAQIRMVMKKVGGIPITSEDVKDYRLAIPQTEKEDPEPMSLDEFKLICDNTRHPRRKMMYRIMKDTEARIGATVQLRKKHFNTEVRPIAITFPKSIMKKKNGIAFTNVKYVIKEDEYPLLKLLKPLGDNDLVFGTNEKVEMAKNTEEKTWARLVQKLGFTERYYHSGHLKKNIHSIKSMTFTAARKAVDADYANAYGDHAEYCKNYLRLTDEEKIEQFKKLEPYITMYTKTEIVHDAPQLLAENVILKQKLEEHDKLFEKINKKETRVAKTAPDDTIRIMEELLRKHNIIP